MRLSSLLALPPPILVSLLCASSAYAELHWPHNVPRHLKYYPEDEVLARRGEDVKRKLQYEKPVGVKKMSTDEGEMFMLDNWIFASDLKKRETDKGYGNDTIGAQSPLRPLEEEDFLSYLRIRAVLSKRQFACPAGTNSCASIGAPDVCCGSNANCVTVSNSPGVGNVGCCPKGQTCAGPVSCDTNNGYTSCPDAPNGGCCLPGFRCAGIGCAAGGTSTAFPPPPSSSPPPPPSSTAVIVVPTSPPTSATPTPTPSSSSALSCTSGYFSCPASLGGGCCQNGLTCATGASCLGGSSTNTQAPSAPIRPTSGIVTSAPTPSSDVCPVGFYVCSAYYPSGCCRVGRDCQSTGSCGLPISTIVNTNGVVVVAPSGAGVASSGTPQRGTCPSAWYSCAANRGGNCCPNGYECGEQCTATASGQSGVAQKVAPSSASIVFDVSIWLIVTASIVAGIAMIVL